MAYRALTQVLLGLTPPAQPGDLLPDTFLNMDGHPEPVDFDRLLEIGAAEEVRSPKAKPARGDDS